MPNNLISTILCVGSNLGRKNVDNALIWLKQVLDSAESSSIYSTPAVNQSGMPYDNAVVAGLTNLTYEQLNNLLKDYEINAGRNAETRIKGHVPIDIDIVIYDARIIRDWDYRQNFFKIGFSELACSVIEK